MASFMYYAASSERIPACRLFIIGTVLAVAASAVQAQQPASPQLSEATALEVVFREVIMVDAHLAQLGSASTASELNGRYKALFSLSDDEDAALKRVARDCLKEITPVDKRAAEIISAVKARYRPSGTSVRAERVPPPPPELLVLQNQKAAILGKHLRDLESSMGRSGFALLASKVRRHVAAHSGQGSAK